MRRYLDSRFVIWSITGPLTTQTSLSGSPMAPCPHQISTEADKSLDHPPSFCHSHFSFLTFSPWTFTFHPGKCSAMSRASSPTYVTEQAMAWGQEEPSHTSSVVIPAGPETQRSNINITAKVHIYMVHLYLYHWTQNCSCTVTLLLKEPTFLCKCCCLYNDNRFICIPLNKNDNALCD